MAALAASLFTTGLQTFSSLQANRTQTKYTVGAYNANARTAQLQAEDAIMRGEEEAHRTRLATRQMVARQRAAFAGQGVELDSGSPLLVQEETAAMGELDALRIRNNAWREAWGYRSQAAEYSGRGRIEKLAGRVRRNSTLLTGGLSMLRDYQMYQQPKLAAGYRPPAYGAALGGAGYSAI